MYNTLWNNVDQRETPNETDIPIRKELFKERLTKISLIFDKQLLLENSASLKCFGTTLKELLTLTENQPKVKICLDTAHAYFAGIDLVQFNKDLQHENVRLIHVNG